jgi:hypothetical protein
MSLFYTTPLHTKPPHSLALSRLSRVSLASLSRVSTQGAGDRRTHHAGCDASALASDSSSLPSSRACVQPAGEMQANSRGTSSEQPPQDDDDDDEEAEATRSSNPWSWNETLTASACASASAPGVGRIRHCQRLLCW